MLTVWTPCSSPAVFSPDPSHGRCVHIASCLLRSSSFSPLHSALLRSTVSLNPSKRREVVHQHLGNPGSVISIIIFQEPGVNLVT